MRFLLNNKVWTLLGNAANFFFAYGERKLFFQPFKVDRLSLKLAAILVRPKQRSDVTGCVTRMPRWKFRVITGEEASVRRPQKTSLGHVRAVKQLIIVGLDLHRRRVDPEAFQSIQLDISRIFYVYIFCKQANERELFENFQNNRDTWSMAIAHLTIATLTK